MLSAAVDLQRPDLRNLPRDDPNFPGLVAPLRTAAEYVARHHGPHPLLGLRTWFDGRTAADGIELTGSSLADGSRVDELLADSARLWGGSPHASAALAWKTYCYWAVAPAVLGYISARRVPLLEADNFVFTIRDTEPRFSARQPRPRFLALGDDPMASAPGVEAVADEGVMLRRMRESLFDRHLDPVLEAVRAEVRIGRRTLLGSLASGIAYATATCADTGREPAEKVARALLDTFGVADLVDVSSDPSGRLVYQRHTCCLAFTIDGCGTCATCCVQTEHR